MLKTVMPPNEAWGHYHDAQLFHFYITDIALRHHAD